MRRRTFQALGILLVLVLAGASALMASMSENEAAIGLAGSAAFTFCVVIFFGRLLES